VYVRTILNGVGQLSRTWVGTICTLTTWDSWRLWETAHCVTECHSCKSHEICIWRICVYSGYNWCPEFPFRPQSFLQTFFRLLRRINVISTKVQWMELFLQTLRCFCNRLQIHALLLSSINLTLYFALSVYVQPNLTWFKVTANKITQFFGTSLEPCAKGTGNGKVKKNMLICDTDEKIPSTET